ncbi:MAG: LamG-like jellyroll fold domain-containing protein, partial [Candidatus Nanohalobium sp.]
MSFNAAAAFSCDTGGLGQSTCTITNAHDITSEVVTDSNTDIIVDSGGRLYTNHVNQTNANDAKISLTNGDFIVKAGGAVHANINISAYNIKVEKGGVIDATGLGWQAAASGSSSCKFGTSPDGYCLGGGPAGGSGGDGNSNTGAGGAGYGGKGGSYVDSSVSYTATGGGRGSVNNETYGNPENPTSFGSGGGAEGSSGPETIVGIESTRGHGMASNYPNGSDLQRLINNATYGDGDTDDPDDDPVDGDRWISTGKEYRKNNPYDILMGSGGGRIKLVGSNKINISGYVLSNGLDAGGTSNNGYPMGAGSGGSILISAGGIFGSGTIRADGGSYSEWLDGDDANTGSSGVSGGGGGGRIYYEYSIAEKNWTVTAERGIGNVNSSEGFAKNTNKQDSGHRDEHSTDGTIRSQIAFSANVNDTIINPNGPMKVNGTASSNVTVKINGTKVGETEPRASDGFYNLTVEGMDINETKNFGNYTMEVSSTISGNTITETFQISHRTLKIDQSSDYILKPGEQFTAEGLIQKVKEDGSGGSKKVDFSNENFFFNLSSGNNDLSSTTLTTNSTGGFKLTETVPTTKGRKYYTTKAENSGGIEGFDRKNISWMKLNDSIVDPGQYIQVNGTAYSPVYIYLENQSGRKEFRAKVNPNSNGYFSYSLKSLQIQNKSKLGNYTITVKTKLNGKNRTEKFNISYREIEIDNKPDFLLKPGEDLQFSNFTDIIKEDGSGGAKKVDYAGETLTFSYLNQSSTLNSTDIITNSTGGFSVFHNLEPTPGLKRFTLETKNENGITDTVQDNDLKNINNRTLAWTGIDDYIVNSGGKIKVNGSAYNKVELIFNGTTVNNSVNPDPENGFFRSKFSVPEIQDTEAFGNYTLGINTSLNGKELSEKFEVSIRGIRFNLTRDYPVRVDPGENFTVSGQAVKYIPNGSGGSKAVNYSNEKIKIVYRDQFGEIQTKTTTTNSSGEFKIENFKSPLNAGDRIIEISTVNSEGIRHERIKTIKTRIRVENSSTTSPSLRLFKDSNLEQTRFINPTQEVDFSVKTRKSLDFVKEVYANVTLPNGSLKQVELNAKGVLGKRLNSASEWDSGDTSHLTHRDTLGNLYADRLRLGYEPEDSDNVILSFPMETGSGKVKDTSGRNHDAIISGTVNRLKSGVFSTNATELAGGTLRIDNRSAVNLASNFTLTTWIKTSDSGAIYSRASNDEANINPELRITSSGKALIQIASGGTATTVNSSTSVDDSKWHQVTGRYNTTHLSIYVDGQIEQTTTVNSEISKFQRDPIIGDSGTFNDRPFAGKIDNLRVHNKSLSNSKISDIGSRKGTFESSTITTEKEVKDILKLLNFKGDLNNQEISIQVFSDYNSDSTFEENSTVINLSDGTEIRSVKGFKNSSK